MSSKWVEHSINNSRLYSQITHFQFDLMRVLLHLHFCETRGCNNIARDTLQCWLKVLVNPAAKQQQIASARGHSASDAGLHSARSSPWQPQLEDVLAEATQPKTHSARASQVGKCVTNNFLWLKPGNSELTIDSKLLQDKKQVKGT